MRLVFSAIALLIAGAAAGAARDAPGPEGLAVPVDGQPFKAKLAAVEEPWRCVFLEGRAERIVAAADLISWGSFADSDQGPQILLDDGSLLRAEVAEISPPHLRFESRLWGAARLPLERVQAVVVRPPLNPLERDRLLFRLEAARDAQDRLWLDNGDVIPGVLRPPSKADAGRASLSPSAVWIQLRAGQPAIPIERIVAIVIGAGAGPAAKPAGGRCLLGFRDGSRLQVVRISTADGAAALQLAGGLQLTAQAASLWPEITLVRPLGLRVLYLSDRQSIAPLHVPFLETEWPLQVDRNVLGGRLRSRGKTYAKGLGVHSMSRLAYDVPDGARWFQAELAIDDSSGLKGSVVFRVYTSGREGGGAGHAWRLAFQSQTVRGGQQPKPISVDVTAARRIALIVDFADQGDVLDRANWLSARFVN
jgi:hypothetical protein